MADELRVIDNPHAPHIFADDALGFFLHQDNIRITLSVFRPSQPVTAEFSNVVIGAVTMPVNAAQRLVLGLYDFMKKQGLDPEGALGGGEPGQAAH